MTGEVIRYGYLNRLWLYKDADAIKVITGMRRVGKSVLMRQFISVLQNSGIPKESITYIDMDSVRYDRYRDGKALYSDIMSKDGGGRQYILIDEVQNISDWIRIVESLRNDTDCDIYITGSNAYMLSTDLSTLLTGRNVPITVMPLSFGESMLLHGDDDTRSAFVRYMRHGGLPIIKPAYSEEVSFQMIEELKSDIILKDICRRNKVDPQKIRNVIDYLYSEVGNPISVKRISDTLGIATNSASDYLRLITDSMLFLKAERYDLKGNMVLTQEPKYYCSDTGMRYSQPISAKRDFGKTLENIVYLELVRRGCRVYVGKTDGGDSADRHLEIDFIVMRDDVVDYYQVTESLNDPAVYEREVRPLRKISGRGERYIITYDDVPVTKSADAIVENIRDFLMERSQDGFDLKRYGIDPYLTISDIIASYVDICIRISETVVTSENFDALSSMLQERFFDLQAYFRREEFIEDTMLQDSLANIRKNNVRIFNSMIGCVNANTKGSGYCPQMGGMLEELKGIKDSIIRHISEGPNKKGRML